MRIISGSLKGKRINFLKSSVTRPLKDSVKENIFNIIKHSNHFNVRINHSKILDLYVIDKYKKIQTCPFSKRQL